MIICSYVSKKFPPDWPLAYLFWRSAVSRWIPQCHPDSQHASHQVRISRTHFPWYTTFQHRQVMCNANVKGWFLTFINATVFLPFIWCITRRGKRRALVHVIHNVSDCNLMQVLESAADKGRPKRPILHWIHLDRPPEAHAELILGVHIFIFLLRYICPLHWQRNVKVPSLKTFSTDQAALIRTMEDVSEAWRILPCGGSDPHGVHLPNIIDVCAFTLSLNFAMNFDLYSNVLTSS